MRRSIEEKRMVDAKAKLLHQSYYEAMQTTSLQAEVEHVKVLQRMDEGSEMEHARRSGMTR